MLISRLKAIAGLDITERRKPQDGSVETVISGRTFKLRLATTSTPSGESLIVRLLEPEVKAKELQFLGMTDDQVRIISNFTNRTQGLILIVGPTGSGKTTTIYSLLSHIDCRTRSLISVEDPVKYRIPFANQQQVNEKGGVTFDAPAEIFGKAISGYSLHRRGAGQLFGPDRDGFREHRPPDDLDAPHLQCDHGNFPPGDGWGSTAE